MESEGGSQEQSPEHQHDWYWLGGSREGWWSHCYGCDEQRQGQMMNKDDPQIDVLMSIVDSTNKLDQRELDAIVDGEPYCFRCGKPASSFPEYDYQFASGDRADYVRNEEGTYNPETNRFACDA